MERVNMDDSLNNFQCSAERETNNSQQENFF